MWEQICGNVGTNVKICSKSGNKKFNPFVIQGLNQLAEFRLEKY